MTPKPSKRILICGGGVAGIEALLALRTLLEVGVQLHLIAPNSRFVYQPLAVAASFDRADTNLLDLAEIAAEHSAELHVDALVSVDPDSRQVRLSSGVDLPYDVLIVAVGTQRREWLDGALHFSGAADVAAFRSLLELFEAGSEQRLTFVSPTGVNWTLPLYELALLTAAHLVDRGVIGTQLTVVTSEADPLAVFGPAAGRMLRDLLADRGIALKVGAAAEKLDAGKLRLGGNVTIETDRVVALPELEGPHIAGLPSDADGFIPVDEHSRVLGLDHVYAVGDATSFPIKQGGIAAQQADAAAEDIAARMGAAIAPSPIRPTLRGMLLTGIAPTYLRAWLADARSDAVELAGSPLWWPPSKIAGRYLAPYLAAHNPLAHDQTLQDRPPSTQDPATLERLHAEARELALTFAEHDAGDGHFESALQWLEVIERLDGVLPPGYPQKRSAWQESVPG